MLVAICECKFPPLDDTGEDKKLTTDFEKILTFSRARGFDFVLPLGVMTPLITSIMSISCPCIFGREYFDMLKSAGFGALVRPFSSSRQSDRINLG